MRFELNYGKLYADAEYQRFNFTKAEPFPHICIDNFLNEESYQILRESFPAISEENRKLWKKAQSKHTQGKHVTRKGQKDLKELQFSEISRRIFMEFNSGLFLHYLTCLTRIPGLVNDPYFVEAGYHAIERGGFLHAHVDFSHNRITGLERKLNFFLYLNEDWKEEYGGAISFYNTSGEKIQSFLPIANRCVIFQASNISFHGHPEPLNCPNGVYRKSIAIYYYSKPSGRPEEKIVFLNA